jgi:hypothetical protein
MAAAAAQHSDKLVTWSWPARPRTRRAGAAEIIALLNLPLNPG